MNDDVLLLKETAKFRDIVELGVCSNIYRVCDGLQFKHMPASDFICFLNLKLPKEKVHPLPKERQRICYMIYAVSQTIEPAHYARMWVKNILDLCNISFENYDKHKKSPLSGEASTRSEEFRKLIDGAIRRAY